MPKYIAHTKLIFFLILLLNSLSSLGQAISDTAVIVNKEIEEITIIQQQTSSIVQQRSNKLVVDMDAIEQMPKFLGTSDPIRYIQSLAGVSTNSEGSAGIHIQGCDDYQTLTSINGAPVYYPNHLLGLYSTFIPSHFSTMIIEQSEHRGTMENRIGGLVDLHTHYQHPSRFKATGNVGLIHSDATLTIPCGGKCALWLSGRASYINLLYDKWLKIDNVDLGYNFGDTNLTYAIHPNDKDDIVFSGFFSNDKMDIANSSVFDVNVNWHNIMGSIYWNRRLLKGNWRTTLSFSGFDNKINIHSINTYVNTKANFSTIDLKNRFNYRLRDDLMFNMSIDYTHYFYHPLSFSTNGIGLIEQPATKSLQFANELSIGLDLRHDVNSWFSYHTGLHTSGYVNSQLYGGIDPRVSFLFMPAEEHEISMHVGCYTQYFHKAGLIGGGFPTDFFLLSDSLYHPERAIGTNLRYSVSFLNRKWTFLVETYFKQLYNIVESRGNILQLVNQGFDYDRYLMTGEGQNYGLNFMCQKNKGVITGYVTYTLGWARRKLPQLDGSNQYIYAASHERRHDLNIVLNARFAKRWTISSQFVLASGLPYTKAEEAYILNGKMFCRYSTFNGAHMPLYNRLDLSCSCDILKTSEHELGINLSLYNVYCSKNAQFVVYGETLQPMYASLLSMIIPSISIYGTF